MYKFNLRLFGMLEIEDIPREELYFVLDDTVCIKMGKMMENVSYIFDHNLGRSVLGYCILTLGLLAGNGFYPIDFAYRFGKKRRDESPENIGNKKSISGQRSYEAKHNTKLELAVMMVTNAVSYGICPGYVLFDSWFAWPAVILAIRNIGDKGIHVICRLKNNNVKYLYKGKEYKLKELYKKVKTRFKKDKKTGLMLTRIRIKLPESDDYVVIVFSKGYCEPEESVTKGVKKKKKAKWVAFLSTNANLHSSTIIEKYTKRWSVEVCFKECKQMLSLGKDQSNNFNAQVFATTATFIRYNLLNYLNENENHAT
ncbi:transposase, partial [Desulfobacterales bacterium HSG17]|nr:transposase [Desulfobacterales bacterium HSG17]